MKSFYYVLDANVKRLSAYLKLGIFFTLFFGVVDIYVRLSKVGWKCEPMYFCLIYMCWPGGKCTQGPAFPTPPRPPTPPPSPISKFYPPHFRSLKKFSDGRGTNFLDMLDTVCLCWGVESYTTQLAHQRRAVWCYF